MATVADYIQDNREHIIQSFHAKVSRLDLAHGLSEAEILDTLPEYLSNLIARSRSAERANPKRARKRLEETHIGLRLRMGFGQEQVIDEYVLLGRLIAGLWEGRPPAERPEQQDIQRLFDELQSAMDHVVTVFSGYTAEDTQAERRDLRRMESLAIDVVEGQPSLPLRSRLQPLLAVVQAAMDADGAALFLVDDDQRLAPICAVGHGEKVAEEPVALSRMSFLTGIARREEAHYLADAAGAGALVSDEMRHSGLRSLLGLRLYPYGKLMGVLYVGITEVRAFEPRARQRLNVLVEHLSAIIDRATLFEDLRSSQDRFRSLLDSAVEGIYGIDRQGRCSFANPSCVRLLKVSGPEALMGRSMHELMHHTKAGGEPYPEDECPIMDTLHTGKPVHRQEELLWRSDGSSFVGEYHAAAIHEDTEVVGAVVTFSDLSARKAREASLQRLERWAGALDESLEALVLAGSDPAQPQHAAVALNRAVLENALDAVVGMDADDRIIDWNAQAETMFGWARQEALGCSMAELIIPESQRQAHLLGLERYLASGYGPILGRRVEVTALRRNGEEFPVELSITPLPGQSVQLFYAFIRDISRQKQLEHERKEVVERLERTLGLNETFVSVLAHDLRSPLAAMLINAERLRRQRADPAAVAEGIIASGERMGRMIEQLLDVSRARAGGGLHIERQATDLKAVCQAGIDEVLVASPGREVQFEASGDCSGEWDPDRLAQVVSNLVGNAVSHGGHDAAVRVALNGSAPETVELIVANGGAIPRETLPALFEPFESFSHGRRGQRGLGLGLYITREIVHGHGGTIEVQSSEAADTTSFLVRLPRAG